MGKHVKRDDLVTALSWRRGNYIRTVRGTELIPCPVNDVTDLRAYEFLVQEYAKAEIIIDSLLPVRKFSDDMLWVVAAIKWHMLAEWQFTGTDSVGWHQTRATIERAITQGYVRVEGAGKAPGKVKIKKLISQFYAMIEPTGWVTKKTGFTGVATYLIPEDGFYTALHSLPDVRDDLPLLVVPSHLAPRINHSGDLGLSTIRVEASGIGSESWVHLDSLLRDKDQGVTQSSAWSYYNQRGRKAAVLYAMRKAGVRVEDRPNGLTWDQRYTRPDGLVVTLTREYTDRWVLLPEDMTIRQFIHMCEGKLWIKKKPL